MQNHAGKVCLRGLQCVQIECYPAAMPILNMTRCQYSWAKPIKVPQRLNRMTAIDRSFGLKVMDGIH